MSRWPSTKGRQVLRAVMRIGWTVKARKGSFHLQLTHPERVKYTWAFGDSEEISPKMLARIAKHSGLTPDDL